jgi:hypothetical protein
MPKPKSRAQRWQEAVSASRDAYNALYSALVDLQSVQSEYTEWRDNLPENLQGSSLGEKLEEVAEMDLDPGTVLSEVDDALTLAEVTDLPLGFGRD